MMGGVGPSNSARGDDAPIVTRGRVIVTDDDALFREGLALLLARCGYEVVAQAPDGARLLELVEEHLPEIVIVDVRMPPTMTTEGLVAAQIIRERFPSIAILVLSAYVEVEQAVELLISGDRVGYLLKGRIAHVGELIDALERICRGGSVIDPTLVQELLATHRRDDPLAGLTDREREVLTLMAEGRTNASIAAKLRVRENTVEKHVSSIMMKLCIPGTETGHRRVLAVLKFLESQ